MNDDFAESFLMAVVTQNADKLRGFFADKAVICWHNSNEMFTADEYVRANCEYPGEWNGEIERVVNGSPLIIVAKVWTGETAARVVSIIELSDGKITRLDEYWGDVGKAPQWRLDMKIGRKISEGAILLPAHDGGNYDKRKRRPGRGARPLVCA